MRYSVQFQYLPEGQTSPLNYGQDDEIVFEDGEFTPIPNVGDSVSCMFGGESKAFKVVSRHFGYFSGWCAVNIVVTDISAEEYKARLKE